MNEWANLSIVLSDELQTAMRLLGVVDISELGEQHVDLADYYMTIPTRVEGELLAKM